MPHSAASAIDLRTPTESPEATAVEDTPVDGGPVDCVTADSRVSMATYHGRTIDLRDGWDGASGTGAVYTGPTWAWVQSATMVPFWDNRISSIYIN